MHLSPPITSMIDAFSVKGKNVVVTGGNRAVVLGSDGISVNSIESGPFHSDLDKDLPESAHEFISKETPCHRFGEPIEIGAYCVFLSSPASSHITGSICVQDGGLICRAG